MLLLVNISEYFFYKMNLHICVAIILSKQEEIYFTNVEDITITGIQEGIH